MILLIDVQTLFTNERNRGIGKYTFSWLQNLVNEYPENRFYIFKKENDKYKFSFITKYLDLNKRLNNPDVWHENNLDEFITQNNVDLVHFTSPLMFDIDFPQIKKSNTKVSCLVYDLIPLVMKDEYFNQWPNEIKKEYHNRLEKIKSVDLILTISNSAKNDILNLLEIEESKVKVIFASVDEEKFYYSNEKDLVNKELGKESKFIFSLTGFDIRKNNEGLIKAFSKLEPEYNDVKLVIGGIKKEEERNTLLKLAQENGISKERFILLGYISDELLRQLYLNNLAFVFISKYEGFGLPVLEAMRCGAPIITSNVSSLPEVAGKLGILVDPNNEEEIIESFKKIISNVNRHEFVQDSLDESKKFSWKKVVEDSVIEFIKVCGFTGETKETLAYFSPLNPQQSGISDYSEELLVYLKNHFDIKIITKDYLPTNDFVKENFEVIDIKNARSILEESKYKIYHMGNNELHKWIYDVMCDYPGILVLHDLNLYGYYLYTTYLKNNQEEFVNEMKYCHGTIGEKAALDLIHNKIYPNTIDFPMFKKVVELNQKVIVHSNYIKKFIEEDTDFNGEIEIIPHGFTIEKDRKKADLKFLNNKNFKIGVFGNVIPNKRNDIIINVFSNLLKNKTDVDLYFVGNIEKEYKNVLKKQIKELKVESNVVFIEKLEIEDFKSHIENVDICINLRWPTMGETSGTLMRALGAGIPCIVSNIGTYSEIPDDIAWKVDVDEYEEKLLLAYLIEVISNRNVRDQMKSISQTYIRENNDFSEISKVYSRVIKGTK